MQARNGTGGGQRSRRSEVGVARDRLAGVNTDERGAPRASPSWMMMVLLIGTPACQPPSNSERYETTASAVLNGDDDRRELFEVERDSERNAVQESVAALMWVHRLDPSKPETLRALSAQETLGLCGDERFAEQPSAAFCSASLIDDDLVLTAGHCLGNSSDQAAERCKRLWIVFDYQYAAPERLVLNSAEDLYACRRVVYHDHTDGPESFMDVAVLELDRPVASDRRRVALATSPPQPGQSLLAASHGAGLPLKVDRGGVVIDVPSGANYLVASTDSFEGGSGAPVFGADMTLVAYQVRGARDWEDANGCRRAGHAKTPGEQHQLVGPAIEAFCGSGWPSDALCGVAPQCGDGICSGPETHQTCAEDCSIAVCGDGLCELGERGGCQADCREYVNVPAGWSSDPGNFQPEEPAAPEVKASGGCALKDFSSRSSGGGVIGLWLSLLLLCRRGRGGGQSRAPHSGIPVANGPASCALRSTEAMVCATPTRWNSSRFASRWTASSSAPRASCLPPSNTTR